MILIEGARNYPGKEIELKNEQSRIGKLSHWTGDIAKTQVAMVKGIKQMYEG